MKLDISMDMGTDMDTDADMETDKDIDTVHATMCSKKQAISTTANKVL
jgi:hypothetical protein